jgi:hypothetical protein
VHALPSAFRGVQTALQYDVDAHPVAPLLAVQDTPSARTDAQ